MLNQEQRRLALELMGEYLDAPAEGGKTPSERQAEMDAERVRIIDEQLKPLLDNYLAGMSPLSEFKASVDGINKRNEYWGFKGIKGQMFFNMVVNMAGDEAECDQELKAVLAKPDNDDMGRSRIRTFASYIRRLGDQHVEGGGSKRGRPKLGSVPFFVSYFWQVQDRHTWPVYYTNSVQTMRDMNLWEPPEDLGEAYVQFKRIHEELAQLFSTESGRQFDHYMVEHV